KFKIILLRQLFTFFSLDDQLITTLAAFTGLQPFGILTGPRTGMTTRSFSFATTHAVVYRVHGHTPGTGADTLPTIPAGLSDSFEAVVAVADFANSGVAVDQHFSQFTGRHLEHGIFFLLVGKLSRSTCAAHQDTALTGL